MRAADLSADAPATSGSKHWALLAEALAVTSLAGAVLASWPTTAPPADLPIEGIPWWGGMSDLLMEGPDAAQWAENALRMARGDIAHLDNHRMPSWLLLTAALVRGGFDVVTAGHLVNRAAFVVQALGVYTIGRVAGGRSVGLLAAILSLVPVHVQLSTQRYGIDGAIAGLLPLALLGTMCTVRAWWAGLLGGALVAFACGLHFTTVPYLLPGLVLLVARSPGGWRQAAGLALHLVGYGLGVAALLAVYNEPTWEQAMSDLLEGMRPGSLHAGVSDAGSRVVDQLLPGLLDAVPGAFSQGVAQVALPGVPLVLQAALVVLGVLGPGLRSQGAATPGPAWRRALGSLDLAPGLAILCCLAPLPLLHAAGAPSRYGDNLAPFTALLMARGLGSAVAVGIAALDSTAYATVRRHLPRGTAGALILVLALAGSIRALGTTARREPRRDQLADDAVGSLLLARALAETWTEGTGIACPMQEAVMQGGMTACQHQPCPRSDDNSSLVSCLSSLGQWCRADSSLPYVALPGRQMYDPNSPGRPAMDAWVAARHAPLRTVQYGNFTAHLYQVDLPVTDTLIPPTQPPMAPTGHGNPPSR